MSGNTDTTTPGKQYLVITNGSIPKFYVESATGNTKLYDGANLKIFKDSFYTSGNFDKGRIDAASNVAFEVLGASGNTKIAGTLNVGDDFTVENTLGGADTFTVDAQTGDTYVGRHLTINGASTSSPSSGTVSLQVTNLGVSGNKPFKIKQDASIDAFGKVNFYNKNGGRRAVYIANTSGTVSTALVSNVNYLIRPTSNLTVTLPSNAETGDMIRFIDFGGALKYNVTLIINAPAGISIQGNQDGGFGQLLVNTPNAAFGLLYVGEYDSDETNQIPSDNRGWWLMEV